MSSLTIRLIEEMERILPEQSPSSGQASHSDFHDAQGQTTILDRSADQPSLTPGKPERNKQAAMARPGASADPALHATVVATMAAPEEAYPFRAALLQFRTLLRIFGNLLERRSLDLITPDHYRDMTLLIEELSQLCEACSACPVRGTPSPRGPEQ